jgi:hypothetical protein
VRCFALLGFCFCFLLCFAFAYAFAATYSPLMLLPFFCGTTRVLSLGYGYSVKKVMNDAQSCLRLVFATHTSASLRKVGERLQSAALTEGHFSSYQGGSDFLAWCCRTEG